MTLKGTVADREVGVKHMMDDATAWHEGLRQEGLRVRTRRRGQAYTLEATTEQKTELEELAARRVVAMAGRTGYAVKMGMMKK